MPTLSELLDKAFEGDLIVFRWKNVGKMTVSLMGPNGLMMMVIQEK